MNNYVKKVSNTFLLGIVIFLIFAVIFLVYPIRFPKHQANGYPSSRIDIKKEFSKMDIRNEFGD